MQDKSPWEVAEVKHLTDKDSGQVSIVLRRGGKPHGQRNRTSKLSSSFQQRAGGEMEQVGDIH